MSSYIPDYIWDAKNQNKRVYRLEWTRKAKRVYAWNVIAKSINDPKISQAISHTCTSFWNECRVYDITNNPELHNQECKGLLGTQKLVKYENK